MKPSEQYQAIFKRKSTRKYDPCPLPEARLAQVAEALREATSLVANTYCEFHIVGPSDLKGLLSTRDSSGLTTKVEKATT
jgi:nitroreductase